MLTEINIPKLRKGPPKRLSNNPKKRKVILDEPEEDVLYYVHAVDEREVLSSFGLESNKYQPFE